MEEREQSSASKEPEEVETISSSELMDKDLEDVAGGATSCTPDQPITLPNDSLFTLLEPTI